MCEYMEILLLVDRVSIYVGREAKGLTTVFLFDILILNDE